MFLSCGRLIGVSRGTMISSGRRSLSMTSAARSTSVRERPCAIAAIVFIEQGTIDHRVGALAAAGDPRAEILVAVQHPAAPTHAFAPGLLEVGLQAFDAGLRTEFVDQQAAAVTR